MSDYSKTFGMAPTPVTMVPAQPKDREDRERDPWGEYMRDKLRAELRNMHAAQHTQGRLVVGPETTCGYVEGYELPINLNGQRIGAVDSEEDARRLAACWNACEGFSTGALERDTFMSSIRKSSDAIREMSAQLFAFHAERDQLRAELASSNKRNDELRAVLAASDKRNDELVGHGALKALELAEARALLATVVASVDDDVVKDDDGGAYLVPAFVSTIDSVRMFLADHAAADRAEMKRFPFTPIAERARYLVAEATAAGVVLTVEQRPRAPLAMGNYDTVISVRAARGMS